MRLYETRDIVHVLLLTKPETRNNDYLLWLEAVKMACSILNIPDVTVKTTFADFMVAVKYTTLPKYESVSRSRRKLQEDFPALKGTADTQHAREVMEEEYLEFLREVYH